MRHKTPIYGLMAEFRTAEQILEATRRARQEGYRQMDAYTPYTVEALAEELDLPRTRVPFVVLMGGLVGAGAGFFMQYWAMAVDYPLNVGGRPYNSWRSEERRVGKECRSRGAARDSDSDSRWST